MCGVGIKSSQEFIVDDTGILGRKVTDIDDDGVKKFSAEQLRIVNNTLLFTDDNWKTSKLALGKIVIDDEGNTSYGLVAETLIGKAILGENLNIGNADGTVSITDKGITILDGNKKEVFNADNKGNLALTGVINATAGGTIGGFTIGESAIHTEKCQNMGSDSVGVYIGTSGINLGGKFKVNNTGWMAATSGTIGGFYIGSKEIYNGRNTLQDSGTTSNGVYIGTDGISLGYNSTDNTPKILMTKDGKFSAIDAEITGNATLNSCILNGNISGNEAYFVLLSAKTLKPSQIIFSNGYDKTNNTGKYTISAGTLGGNTATATVEAAYGGTVTVTCNQTLSVARNFPIQWTGSNGILGSGSGSVIVTVKAGETTGTATIKSYHSYTVVFEESGESSLTFAVGASEGFVFTSNILPPKGTEYTLGDEHHYWKKVYATGGVETSDRKIKKEIATLSESVAMELISKLEPKTYKFKDFKTPRMRSGFIAQEVEEVLLSMGLTTEDWALVSKSKPNEPDGEDNLYSISYMGLISPIVKVLQNLIGRVEKIEKNYPLNEQS